MTNLTTMMSWSLAAALLLAAAATTASAKVGDDNVCAGRVGQVCTSCDRLAVCARLDGTHVVPVVNMACPTYAPFCSHGRCTRVMDVNNPCDVRPSPSTSFQCPSGYSGYLPDPSSCARYHYCANGKAWDYECRVGLNTRYDHASAACVSSDKASCQTCGRQAYAVYQADNTIAFDCTGRTASVVVCPANHRLDVKAGVRVHGAPACVRFCPREGRQAASDDPDSKLYYECLADASGTLLEPVLNACPDGTVFSAGAERCVVVDSSDSTDPSQ